MLAGIVCMAMQFVVSIRRREALRDDSGDPWNGRTLEWMTASPPAPYNFAVIPRVESRDAFADLKARGLADARPQRYEPIAMPNNSMIGILLGGFGFVLGFAMVWHIWWLAAACAGAMFAATVARACDDDAEHVIPAEDVAAIERRRARSAARVVP